MSVALKAPINDRGQFPQNSQARQILVVAGEVSGDHHGAGVVRAWRSADPSVQFFGMGGSYLRDAGMTQVIDSEKDASVMGFTEVLSKLGVIIRAFKRILREVDQRKPELAILIDYPDFNLRLAKALSRRGVKVLYYVSPQLWAWRRGRLALMKKHVSLIAPIFPFEEDFYREHDLDAKYVGHPFLDRPPLEINRAAFLKSLGLDSEQKVLALLPGSRIAELERLLVPMLGALRLLREETPGLQAVLPVAETLELARVRDLLDPGLHVSLIRGQSREVLAVADTALVASGTATVEAALSEVPFVVCYRLSALTYGMARLLVRGVKNFAMVNLIAGEQVVPELLQNEVCPERLAEEVRLLLYDQKSIDKQRAGLRRVRDILAKVDHGEKTSAERVAMLAAQLLESSVLDSSSEEGVVE